MMLGEDGPPRQDEISQLSQMRRDSHWLTLSHRKLPGNLIDDEDLDASLPNCEPRPPRRRSQSMDLVQGAALVTSAIEAEKVGRRGSRQRRVKQSRIYDDPQVVESYQSVPTLEMDKLPRGGISIDTKAVGRIQFGIPPETIKDSMRLGIDVPRTYIVPVDRFCREMGPALGINLAEFEFPAYFNYFVRQKQCTLIVDSEEAERQIRTVFEETLLGPEEFRDTKTEKPYDEEDFDPTFPLEERPHFYREFKHFRKTPDGKELGTDCLVEFCHFTQSPAQQFTTGFAVEAPADRNVNIGVPPIDLLDQEEEEAIGTLHASMMDLSLSLRSDAGIVSKHAGIIETHTAMPLPASLSRAQTGFAGELRHSFARTVHSRASRDSSRDSFQSNGSWMSSLSQGAEDKARNWMFSQVKWLGEVATVWPADATAEQIEKRSVPRVEIFKMPGGTEYIIHDVDEENHIVGKARLSGTVEVPDEIEVEGFLDSDAATSHARVPTSNGETALSDHANGLYRSLQGFHPPSFGVTILGNSHGFDKNGSTSGYVIWINGRGVMVDPPPYSSATLEREGIRPQTIIAIVITHCHADHDAGAFQKVLTGSRVAIITTPSIYKSFIRKYSALSGLSPRFLRHSHRFRPAIIGQPLRFQGATFYFNFTLHTIPCIALRVEWRGKSIVFTGDHLNHPPLLKELEDTGILSPGRANSLRQLPLQDCDILLHEAGAPPIHTPLTILQSLPEHVKNRLYVVHTSALPKDCGLRVAPVGTAGTLRLDEILSANGSSSRHTALALPNGPCFIDPTSLDDGGNKSLSLYGDFFAPSAALLQSSKKGDRIPPLVLQRPTCVSDAWFLLNLLSNVPFFSSLSYTHTMEILEMAKVDVFCSGDVVIPARARGDTLCVVWEGTCEERISESSGSRDPPLCRWHAGDWLGPVALQPSDERKGIHSAPFTSRNRRDVVATSEQGAKVISLKMDGLEKILRSGSKLYRKYLSVQRRQAADEVAGKTRAKLSKPDDKDLASYAFDHILNVMRFNSVLSKLPAVQKRHLESIAEGPRVFEAGTPLWRLGDRCDYAFLVVAGSASFDSSPLPSSKVATSQQRKRTSVVSIVELGQGRFVEADKVLQNIPPDSEYARLELTLALRTERLQASFEDSSHTAPRRSQRRTSQMAPDRFANKVLARLYASKKFTAGLTFGRGCFLGDTSRMVSGELVHETGDNPDLHLHTTTMAVGPEGCVAMVFPRATFVPFLDANPGTLLCLLGTQAVV